MWRRRECLQRKIKYGKSCGQIEMAVGMFSIFIVTMIMFAGLKIAQFMITGAYVEDALAASNLASAFIDLEEYGKSRVIRIKDPQDAFDIYREALSINLMLDEEGRSFRQELLEGPVEILSYVIFNVEGEKVQIFSFSEEGHQLHIGEGRIGDVYTPDGILVETTAVYSRVRFGVQSIGRKRIQAEKEKSVDIKGDA